MKAIYFERKLEFAMEGLRFFDLSRWGIAEKVLNDFFNFEGGLLNDVRGSRFTPNKNEYFPIHQIEIDKTTVAGKATLTQNTGYQ